MCFYATWQDLVIGCLSRRYFTLSEVLELEIFMIRSDSFGFIDVVSSLLEDKGILVIPVKGVINHKCIQRNNNSYYSESVMTICKFSPASLELKEKFVFSVHSYNQFLAIFESLVIFRCFLCMFLNNFLSIFTYIFTNVIEEMEAKQRIVSSTYSCNKFLDILKYFRTFYAFLHRQTFLHCIQIRSPVMTDAPLIFGASCISVFSRYHGNAHE